VDDAGPRPDGPIGRINALGQQIDRLQRQQEAAILLAVQAGATWAQIGAALGVSAQAAHKRHRWLRHNPVTGETWREPPLPLLNPTTTR